jgi:AraC-like DNA-binding protein
MVEYREIAPAAEFSDAIECFWINSQTGPAEAHRVLPDGCADIIYSRSSGTASLEVVGPMTRYRDFTLPAGHTMVGVRFRPGMWAAHLGIPGDRITDGILPLDSLWGVRARQLLDQLAGARTAEQCTGIFAAGLPAAQPLSPVQRAIAWLERRHGCIRTGELARHAGLGERQFRRLCLEQTGLTPKLLARVLRFRHALSRVSGHGGALVGLALDCGYYDQAHFINEFHDFAGRTPSEFVA